MPLHPHLIGVPHRIGYLARMLDLLQHRKDAIFMNGCSERAVFGLPMAWLVPIDQRERRKNPEFHHPLLMARGTEMPALAGERQKMCISISEKLP